MTEINWGNYLQYLHNGNATDDEREFKKVLKEKIIAMTREDYDGKSYDEDYEKECKEYGY